MTKMLNNNTMDKVVKCGRCEQHFMYTEKAVACPFCHTPYVEVEEKSVGEEKNKVRKVAVKTQKDSFKIWKNN